jgi:hypothetical protein
LGRCIVVSFDRALGIAGTCQSRLLSRAMRMGKVAALACVLLLSWPHTRASAEQPQDWLFAGPGKEGTFVNLDVIFGAVQSTLEHRVDIFGKANQLVLRGSAIAAIPFGSTQLDADLRIVILTLGTSVGAQDTWRNQAFASGDPVHRKIRREREASGEFEAATFGFWEGRAGLVLPFNDYALLNNVNYLRFTGAPDRSFDNLLGVVHDGDYFRSDIQLFARHREVGGIGPMMQILNFPLDGVRHTQLNYGFIGVTRAGLVARDDLLMLQVLFNFGDTLGGYDNRDNYGMAILRAPMTFIFAYRSVIEL